MRSSARGFGRVGSDPALLTAQRACTLLECIHEGKSPGNAEAVAVQSELRERGREGGGGGGGEARAEGVHLRIRGWPY